MKTQNDRCILHFLPLLLAGSIFLSAPPVMAGSIPLKGVHEKLTGCMAHFHQAMKEDESGVRQDRDRSQMEGLEIESSLSRQFTPKVWVEKIYDYFARNQWDWERPKNEKTQTGRVRALMERAHTMDAKLSQLREIMVMRTKASDQLEYLLTKIERRQKTASQDWMEIRNYLRTLEQEYYDFINDQMREKIHEQGVADQVNWNKTMGFLQESFYRETSCVTVMDQVVALIPDTILRANHPSLAAEQLENHLSAENVQN